MILHTAFGSIWTTPWPDEKDLFLKFLFREIQKVLYENPTFFIVELNKKYFLHYTVITMVILHAQLGLIWATPWPDKKQLFLRFSKIRNSRSSQNSVWKTIFLPGKLYQQLFLLYTLITLVILNTEFGLIWTTSWSAEKEFFLNFSKILNSRNSQNSVWKPNFVLRTLYQIFLLYTPITLVILHTPFGLIWTTP